MFRDRGTSGLDTALLYTAVKLSPAEALPLMRLWAATQEWCRHVALAVDGLSRCRRDGPSLLLARPLEPLMLSRACGAGGLLAAGTATAHPAVGAVHGAGAGAESSGAHATSSAIPSAAAVLPAAGMAGMRERLQQIRVSDTGRMPAGPDGGAARSPGMQSQRLSEVGRLLGTSEQLGLRSPAARSMPAARLSDAGRLLGASDAARPRSPSKLPGLNARASEAGRALAGMDAAAAGYGARRPIAGRRGFGAEASEASYSSGSPAVGPVGAARERRASLLLGDARAHRASVTGGAASAQPPGHYEHWKDALLNLLQVMGEDRGERYAPIGQFWLLGAAPEPGATAPPAPPPATPAAAGASRGGLRTPATAAAANTAAAAPTAGALDRAGIAARTALTPLEAGRALDTCASWLSPGNASQLFARWEVGLDELRRELMEAFAWSSFATSVAAGGAQVERQHLLRR